MNEYYKALLQSGLQVTFRPECGNTSWEISVMENPVMDVSFSMRASGRTVASALEELEPDLAEVLYRLKGCEDAPGSEKGMSRQTFQRLTRSFDPLALKADNDTTDLSRLIVSIETDVTEYEKQLEKALELTRDFVAKRDKIMGLAA